MLAANTNTVKCGSRAKQLRCGRRARRPVRRYTSRASMRQTAGPHPSGVSDGHCNPPSAEAFAQRRSSVRVPSMQHPALDCFSAVRSALDITATRRRRLETLQGPVPPSQEVEKSISTTLGDKSASRPSFATALLSGLT